jgi:hypothetical protein
MSTLVSKCKNDNIKAEKTQNNKKRKCGIYIQWNFTQPQRIMKFVIHRSIDATGEYHLQ